jgi:hypothetical protein
VINKIDELSEEIRALTLTLFEARARIADLLEIIDTGIEMRQEQKQYFMTKSREALVKSKILEKRFDNRAEQVQRRRGKNEGAS